LRSGRLEMPRETGRRPPGPGVLEPLERIVRAPVGALDGGALGRRRTRSAGLRRDGEGDRESAFDPQELAFPQLEREIDGGDDRATVAAVPDLRLDLLALAAALQMERDIVRVPTPLERDRLVGTPIEFRARLRGIAGFLPDLDANGRRALLFAGGRRALGRRRACRGPEHQ